MEYIQVERTGLGRHRGGHSSRAVPQDHRAYHHAEGLYAAPEVDYVPVLKEVKLPELIEFALHLVISVLLSILLASFLKSKNWSRGRSLSWVTLVCLAVGLLLYPTTVLSNRTPELPDLAALLFWLGGHLLYGIALGWLLTGSRKASA